VYWLPVLIVIAVGALVAYLWFRLTYGSPYRRMFSEEHFRELHKRFVDAVRAAEERIGDLTLPDEDDARAFVTSAQFAVAVSLSLEEGSKALHISLSQTSGYTTSTVASRLGFFVAAILNQNSITCSAFYTASRVHHLVMTYDQDQLTVNSFDDSFGEYRANYTPIPYSFEQLPESGDEQSLS